MRADGDAEIAEGGFDEMFDVLTVLSVRQRAAVVLRYYERRTEQEIANMLDCRPGSVGPLISRALKRLRVELAEWDSPTTNSSEGVE